MNTVYFLAYIFIAGIYFIAWYFLRPLDSSRYQHVAAYVGGMIAIVFAINTLLSDYQLYANLLIAYVGLIFGGMYIMD